MIEISNKKINDVWYGVAINNKKIIATCFSQKEKCILEDLIKHTSKDSSFQLLEKPNLLSEQVITVLDNIFNGKNNTNNNFEISMQHLSTYSQKVLKNTSLVPIGYVTTYNLIAKITGGNARSVGRVEALNPFPLLIPCHRIIRSDLTIGGYRYGEETKMKIIQKEERGYQKIKKIRIKKKNLDLIPIKWIKNT